MEGTAEVGSAALVTGPPCSVLCQTHQNAPGWCRWVGVFPASQAGTMKAASCTAFSILEHSTAWEGCDLPGQCQHASVVLSFFWTFFYLAALSQQSYFLNRCDKTVSLHSVPCKCMHACAALEAPRPKHSWAAPYCLFMAVAATIVWSKCVWSSSFIRWSFAPAIKIQCAPTSSGPVLVSARGRTRTVLFHPPLSASF